MESVNGKREQEEAGPSDGTKQEMTEKVSDALDDGKAEEEEVDEDEEGGTGVSKNGFFVPGPLVSLKEQIELDKVFMIFTLFFLSRISHLASFMFWFVLGGGKIDVFWVLNGVLVSLVMWRIHP